MNYSDRADSPASKDQAHIQAFVQERFVDMFLSQNRRAQLGLFIAAAIVAFIWFGRTQSAGALVWLVALGGVTVLRYRYTERWVRDRDAQPTQRIAAVLLVNGVMMAVPLVAFDRLSELERAAMSIIVLATATASVATTSGRRSVFLAFAVPMVVPLAFAWALARHDQGSGQAAFGVALLVLLFLAFLVSVGKQANAQFEESCRFRYGEQQLNAELKQALEQASESNRAKTQFLAAASHDLRQPLHSMNVLVAALTLRELDGRSREIVGLLDSVNQTLSKQLDGLLDISKLDAGAIRPELSVHRLDQLVASHHAAMAPVARERGLKFTLDIAEPASGLVDGPLLTRALSNLTDNAFKFTRRGGAVSLSLRREQGQAVLAVTDDGIGIAQDEQERVFREFYQVGNTERDRAKGLGLGLSIVRRLCGLLGVDLRLASQPGAGTTVTLRLPEVAAVQTVATTSMKAGVPKGLTVLVVDDEPMVRDSMRLLLSELGCTVLLADGTEQATRAAAAQRIDAVLSDYRLREGDSGLQVMRAVQNMHPGVRAALVTGDTAPDRIRDAESVGVPLLHKPVTLADLLSVLQPGSAKPGLALRERAP
jgi:signal transduction histidine kinase/ActR/RegA family two-component response regulator